MGHGSYGSNFVSVWLLIGSTSRCIRPVEGIQEAIRVVSWRNWANASRAWISELRQHVSLGATPAADQWYIQRSDCSSETREHTLAATPDWLKERQESDVATDWQLCAQDRAHGTEHWTLSSCRHIGRKALWQGKTLNVSAGRELLSGLDR